MSLYETFKSKWKTNLQKKLKKNNIHQVPVLDKVIVSMGIGSLATRKWVKDFEDLKDNIKTITGQEPQMILSKKSVSNFKLREGMPVMLNVTLRGGKAYDFVERMVSLVLPRVRDFAWIAVRKFDGRGNYSLGFKDQTVFPEIIPENVKTPMGVQVSFCTTADTDADARALLEECGLIFEKKE